MNSSMMTVNSLNIKIKSLLEATFMHIKVEGEVASATYHQASGHIYFTIKDDQSAIKCVMFRSSAIRLKFKLEKGEHIVVEGSVGVYTPRGEYQFYAVHIEPFGRGALALAYEQLKEKLKNRGYFEPENKKPIPKNIQKLALVTAKNSAALHDMIKIIEKRYPLVEVTIIDTLVQGENASREIAQALRYADKLGVDVIVVGRGGGSAEDLWAFNEEVVADAIFALKTPVVSAVGHEIDTLISDFVADLRAPTPSAAIEMILPDKQELLYTLDDLLQRYRESIQHSIFHKERLTRQYTENLQRFSIETRLGVIQKESFRIMAEYKRVMYHKITNYNAMHLNIKKAFFGQFYFAIEQKKHQANLLEQHYSLNNPRNRVKKGWANVSIKGRSVALDEINIESIFTLEDSDTKIEALCIKKSKF